MILTILVSVNNPSDIKELKPFIDSVEKCGYNKGKIEVVFVVVSQEDKGSRTFEGLPVVKVRYYKDRVTGLNDSNVKALGDVVMFCDIQKRFDADEVMYAIRAFSWNTKTRLVLGKGFQVIRNMGRINSWITFPQDLFCLKTHLIVSYTLNFDGIIGKWGKLNRKEVLRLVYKFDQIGLKKKISLIGATI